jgi:uncharacterized protein (DUF1800 family)
VTAPATANHIATKLARHFAGDEPPVALVERLSRAFADTQGDLPTLYRVLIDSPEPWAPRFLKFKTPWEWFVSALRGIGFKTADRLPALQMLSQLGQAVWEPAHPQDGQAGPLRMRSCGASRSPADWRRSRRIGTIRASSRPSLLAISPPPNTRAAVEGADSPLTGLALLLVSPEFQRR